MGAITHQSSEGLIVFPISLDIAPRGTVQKASRVHTIARLPGRTHTHSRASAYARGAASAFRRAPSGLTGGRSWPLLCRALGQVKLANQPVRRSIRRAGNGEYGSTGCRDHTRAASNQGNRPPMGSLAAAVAGWSDHGGQGQRECATDGPGARAVCPAPGKRVDGPLLVGANPRRESRGQDRRGTVRSAWGSAAPQPAQGQVYAARTPPKGRVKRAGPVGDTTALPATVSGAMDAPDELHRGKPAVRERALILRGEGYAARRATRPRIGTLVQSGASPSRHQHLANPTASRFPLVSLPVSLRTATSFSTASRWRLGERWLYPRVVASVLWSEVV